ncbi:MAG: CoA pyrophosphatase [Anaerolineae bacterium]|nr:CoA pyrophosphatase [Anaerolineae bacterium]MDW8069348.1 CoA pyrophosphatase [Anaerolineae bacterium]
MAREEWNEMKVRAALRCPLPGITAQVTMSPRPRPIRPPDGVPPRQAGVLILLYPVGGQLHMVFTVRPTHLNHHAGQVSFPGGGWEKGDTSLAETALRETREELGIPTAEIEVLGPLTPLYVPTSHNLVHPFVALAPRRPAFQPDPLEVAELLEVPLATFRDPTIRGEDQMERDGQEVVVPYYAVGHHKIWGATAAILAEFLALLNAQPEPPMPDFPGDSDASTLSAI